MRMGLYYSGGYDWPYNDAVLTTGADAVLAAPHGSALRGLRDGARTGAHRAVLALGALERHLVAEGPGAAPALRRLLQRRRGRCHQRPLEGTGAGAERGDRCARALRRCRRAGAVAVHPREAQAPHLRQPEALRLPHPRVRRPAHGLGTQVGAGPRRRALLRGQPARGARGHHFRDGAHPDVLRCRVEERQLVDRRGPAAGRHRPGGSSRRRCEASGRGSTSTARPSTAAGPGW